MTYKKKALHLEFINIVEDYMIKDLGIGSKIVSDLILKSKRISVLLNLPILLAFFM